jgi:molybdopterin converting factor small subunit
MKITVKLFAQYRDGKFVKKDIDIKSHLTIEDTIKLIDLDITRYPVGIILLNGIHADISTSLNDGDVLSIFPKVGGG